MIFSKISRYFFSYLRPSSLYVLLILPFSLAFGYFIIKATKLRTWEEQYRSAIQKEGVALQRRQIRERIVLDHTGCDPSFIHRSIESRPLLQQERARLLSLLRHPALAEPQKLEERLRWIDGKNNRLLFKEEAIRSHGAMTETEEKQQKPVQMEETDLAEVLTLLEGKAPTKKPLILISDCRIKKVKTSLDQEVLDVNIEFIKREWKDEN